MEACDPKRRREAICAHRIGCAGGPRRNHRAATDLNEKMASVKTIKPLTLPRLKQKATDLSRSPAWIWAASGVE